MKTKTNSTKYFAFTQGFLLVMSLFAFTFIISEAGVVSGDFAENTEVGCWVLSNGLFLGSGICNSDLLARGIVTSVKPKISFLTGETPSVVVNPISIQPPLPPPPKPEVPGGIDLTENPPADLAFSAGFGDTALGHLVQGVTFAMAIVIAIRTLGPMLGAEESTIDALSIAAVAGVAAYELTGFFATESASMLTPIINFFGSAASASFFIGIGVAAIVFLFLYTKNEEKKVIFECNPWQAPTGGNDCEECNDGNLPCSEYQCRSLGQACEIINKGMVEEKCVWVNRQDVNPPEIKPLVSALLNDYRYIPDNAIAPPDRGVEVLFENSRENCAPAFTPLQFGVELNEPGACKIDVLRKQNFDEMRIFMSQGVLNYNHTFALSLPSVESLESQNITVENDGEFSMFVRCRDANGNSNVATFVFSYCIDQGPDTTPPLIVATNILNNMPIAFNQSSIDFEVYVNEPSQCKWSHDDRDYNSMEETMSCSLDVFDFNAQSLYKCSTTLTGLNDRVENKFYFRCRDNPNSLESDRNTNIESYEFTLIGTQPLIIDSVSPNDTTISGSTDSVKVTLEVETSAGHNEGESLCYYSDTGNENDYIKFFETQSFEHLQDLFLTEGDYEYFIKCTDLGGNSDYKTINFDVETDLSSPLITRAYKEENYLKLVTDEEAQCVYSTFGCSYEFDEGTQITVINENNHFADWNVQSDLYVKCRDNFGNQPLPNKCSITVRASDF